MPKLLNGIKGDSNPGSLDCESGILPTELPRSTIRRDTKKNGLTDVNFFDRKDWRMAESRATH